MIPLHDGKPMEPPQGADIENLFPREDNMSNVTLLIVGKCRKM